MRRLILAALLLAATPAAGAERTMSVTSFEKLRVEGPFDVRLSVGRSPGARVEADQRLLDRVELRQDGAVLVVRLSQQVWGETPAARGAVPVVTLATPRLTSASVTSGARLTIDAMKAADASLIVGGAGEMSVTGIASDRLSAVLSGSGRMTLAGRAARARLAVTGTGAIAANELATSDLTVALDGPGTIDAAARNTARVATSGRGAVRIAGSPACTVAAAVPETVTCGR